MKTEEKRFDFICPNCFVNGLKKKVFVIKPLGICWRPDYVDNSDLPKSTQSYYDNLPTLKQALLKVCNINNQIMNLSIYCNKCDTEIPVYEKLDLPVMRRWVNKNLGMDLDLRVKKK